MIFNESLDSTYGHLVPPLSQPKQNDKIMTISFPSLNISVALDIDVNLWSVKFLNIESYQL